MKQGRRIRSMGKAAQVFVSLLLVLSMMGTSVFSVSAAGTEEKNTQSDSAVYMDGAGDNASEEGEDGSQSGIPGADGDVDGDASVSMPENDENNSASDEDESEISPENDQITPLNEEIPEEETTEENTEDEEDEADGDLGTLAVGDICAFAFYCADDTSLNFYYGEQPAVGDQIDGKTVSNVYTEFEDKTYTNSTTSGPPWYSVRASVTSVVVDASFHDVQPSAMAYWFNGFENCVEFTGLENIDTSNVTSMLDTFHECKSVTSLDLSSWDTGKVTTMVQMFYNCDNLAYLNVSGFVTSSATAINGMLRDMYAITELDLTGWDTSNVTAINALFRNDYALKTVYVDENWNLSKVTTDNNRKNLFYHCYSIVGGNGTVAYYEYDNEDSINELGINCDMAHIDTADNPGYFTDIKAITMVDISGTKVWDDADDQDGIRPESVTIYLLANGIVTDSVTVTAEDDWSFTFSDLPEYDDDLNEIEYTFSEDPVDGYAYAVTGDKANGFVITNTHTPAKTAASGTITWADGNNQDGKRPNYVAVQLFAKDDEGGILDSWDFEIHAPEDPTYDDDGNEVWTWTQADLDHYYDGGKEVKYTVIYTVENLDGEYTQTNPNDLDTIYSYTPETTTISGSKTWMDDEDAENVRPDSITVRLHANGNEQIYEQTVTEENEWAWTFEDVPVYSNGTHIDYTITEDSTDNYYPIYDGWNITNVLDLGYTSITVMKDWEDAEDQDGKRPGSVTVDLLANGDPTGETLTLSAGNNWEDDFHGLAIVDEQGVRITYTIEEETFGDDSEGDDSEYATEITGDVTEGFVITNSYTPETIDITGTKIWEDADDQDGMRPSSIYVHLLVDGVSVDDVQVLADQSGDWTFAFDEVPVYAGGTEIEYYVEEVIDSHHQDAYTGEITGSEDVDGNLTFTITNTHTPELLNETGELTVTKIWDDDDDRDGLRPGSVTIHLLADGTEIDEATLGGEAEPASLWQSILNFFTGTRTLAAEVNGWTATFTELPKYADGKEIVYTVTEDDVDGYTAAVTGSTADGFTVTNTHTPETVIVNVTKIWDDAEDQDGKRPAYITVSLLADGDPALNRSGNAITTVMNDDNDWEESFINLYKYRDGGEEITYTIQEDTTDIAEIYTTSTEGDMTHGFTITNSYTPELFNDDGTFRVVLIWDDEANNDGIRPSSVHLTLTKDNTMVEGEELVLTAEDADENGYWIGTFENLPKYENGEEIVYSVNEDVYSGYTYRITLLTDDDGNIYVQLTNVHVSVKEDIDITKVWDDADDQDGKRPDEITVRLLVNGSLYKEKTLTADTEGVDVTEDGKVWKYTMTDIPVDKNGEAIEYTMLEVDVDNYRTPVIETIRGEEITDDGVTYQPYSFVVTNSHTPEQVTVSGTKVWEDADNQDGKRPQYVTLRLYADGELAESIDVSNEDAEENTENSWAWAFTARDRYKDGEEIEYTVTEDEAAGYDTEITGSVEDGFTITNSYTPETTTISGSKTWADDDNAQNMRPSSITVRLHANGTVVETQTVGESDGWAWEFTDLPVYENGQHIDYTLTEDAVDDYDTTYTFGDDGTLNVTNTLSPGNTSLTVEKDWEDNDDQDGIRPAEVTVELLRNGTATGDTLTLSDADNWTDTFHNLAENDDNGVRINYTVQEVSAEGYTSVVTGDAATGYIITNTHTPETVDLSGKKVWEDEDDQDGIRPDSITIHLLADGETVESHSITAENSWAWTFEGLDKYVAGKEITYTMEEVFVADGYEVDPGDAENGFTFTNTHTPEVIDITGTKAWDDDDNRDGIRPGSITVSLLADGEAVLDADDNPVSTTVTPDTDGNWTYAFTDLDKFADGEEIDYSISEDVPDGYSASYTYFSYDVTNTHVSELFNGDGSLSVIMHWDDEDDQDGLRPKRTTITLMLNGVPDETITLVLSDDNVDEYGNWIGTFTDLYKYADGAEIAYNVEEGVMNGYTYTAELVYDESTGLYYIEITNIHAAVTSDITVTKVWDDNDDQDGIRPDSVVVNLFSNASAVKSVTLTPGKEGVSVSDDGNEWSYTFEDMPVEQNGESIIYTLDEVDVGSYAHEIETTTVEGNEKDGITYTKYDFTVTNSHTPETAEVNGTKIWDDAGDQDGIRPNSITIELLADGYPALDENGDEITRTVTPHTDDNWTWTFTDIPKYRDGGTEIVYSFEEFEVDGYTTSYSADGLTVTNTHETETRTISGNKVWDDGEDQDSKRPASITVTLYANGIAKESKEVTAADNWEWTFEDLPVYADGQRITYVTTETAIDEYNTTYSGYTLTNTYEPSKTSVTVIADWEDADDQDGLRPDSIIVPILADGSYLFDENGQMVTLTLTEDENGIWEGTFQHLDENSGGSRITYTIGEITVDGYDVVVTGDMSDGFSLTFTHTPETIDLSVSKTWDDADDQDGMRPEQITVHLLADGEEILTEEVSAEDNWVFTFEDLAKYANGQEITYTINEAAVNGYSAEITGDAADGFEIVNTHIPETVTVSGTKVWRDSNDQDGKRPDSITIDLLTDGSDTQSLEFSGNGDTWEWAFTDLPKYEAGEEIAYSISEVSVEDYDTAVTGDMSSGGYTIVNSYTPEVLTITGSKTWDDEDNQDGLRPNSVTIRLHKDGEVVSTRTVTAYDGWTWTFSNEPKYDSGHEIAYTITEDSIDEYSATIDGYDVTNSYTPGMTSLTVIKDWEDGDDRDRKRPSDITVSLLADGEETDEELTLSEANGWEDTFTKLDEYKDGKRITYSVEEITVDEYDSEITGSETEGYVITNTHKPETIEITGSKIWDDADDQDGKRPESITLNLLNPDGRTVDTISVTDEEDWDWVFTSYKYEDGVEIDYSGYSINEAAVKEYDDPVITGSAADGFEIINTHEPETINSETNILAVSIRWNDDDDTDGLRPFSVTLTLMANGEPILDAGGYPLTVTLTADDEDEDGNWVGEFNLTGINLYRYKDGLEISYTVDEEDDENRRSLSDDGYITRTALVYDEETGTWHLEVTNSHATVMQNITVTKVWDDDNNRDGKRPDSIHLRLEANESAIDGGDVTLTKADVTVSANGNTWTYVFEEVPVDESGEPITYTLTESKVSGYDSLVERDDRKEITESGVTYEPYAFTVTNTHEPETIDISGTITWDDDNNKAGKRPQSVQIFLYDGEGNLIAVTTASETTGWAWSFTGLPKYANGKEIAYKVVEESVSGYREEVIYDEETGEYKIINTYDEEETGSTGGTGHTGGTGTTGTGGQVPTADTNDILLWIVLFLAAVVVAAGVVIFRNRRK